MTSSAPTSNPRAWPPWRWALTGLSAVALALSAYLSWHYLVGGSVIGCGGGGGCDQALNSRWSSIAGIVPVSGLAAGAYLALLVASFFAGPATSPPERRLAWTAMVLLAGAAAGSALWFIIVQRWFVGAFCPYCMATHVTGLLLAGIIFWQAPRQLGTTPVLGLVAMGTTLAGILAVCQLAMAPPAAYRAGETREAAMPALDPHAAPVIGSPDAPYVVTLLFDYNCPHCQRLHGQLDDVVKKYGGKVAFILAPAPLNNRCNPYIAREVDAFKDSCELARLGLAVWVAKPDAFAAFDAWMFAAEPGQPWRPRTLEAATAQAEALVGRDRLEAAARDARVERYLQTSIRIFGSTDLPDGSGNAVPKLVYGAHWVTPEPDNADELAEILHANLKLPRP